MAARISSVIYLLGYVISVYLDSIINNPDLDPSIQTLANVIKPDPVVQGTPLLLLPSPSAFIPYSHIPYAE